MTEPSTHGFLCRAPPVNTHPSFHHILSEISGILTVTSFAILDTLLHAQTLSHVQLFCNPMDCNLLGSSAFGIFLARIRQWGAIFLFQGIFPNQGSNPHLLHCRWILYCLSHQGSLVFVIVLSLIRSRGDKIPLYEYKGDLPEYFQKQ